MPVTQDDFERHLEKASAVVSTWPEWMQNILGGTKKGNIVQKEKDVRRIVVERIQHLEETVKDGWYEGDGKGLSSEGIKWLLEKVDLLIKINPFPYIYPTLEGGILVEYDSELFDASLEINLETHMGEWWRAYRGTEGKISMLDLDAECNWQRMAADMSPEAQKAKPTVTKITWTPEDGLDVLLSNELLYCSGMDVVFNILSENIQFSVKLTEEMAHKEDKVRILSDAIDKEDFKEAHKLLDQLREEFGDNDSDVVRSGTLLAFLESPV